MKTTITIKYDEKDFQKVVSAYHSLSVMLKGVARIDGVWQVEHELNDNEKL